MAMSRTPPVTRSQAALPPTEGTDALRTLLDELRQLREEQRLGREEQQRCYEELEARLERQEARGLSEERLDTTLQHPQLSTTPLLCAGDSRDSATRAAVTRVCPGTEMDRGRGGLRLKADVFDGSVPLREFLAQFDLIARANAWSEPEKAIALASCLRGKARAVLDTLCADGSDSLTYADVKEKLELRFGESELMQDHYLQFTNRRQAPGEDFASLGAELERLSRRAYPECPHEVRDKIGCAQFVAALSDGFVKRTLRTEGVTSLRLAVERANTLKFINEAKSEPEPRS